MARVSPDPPAAVHPPLSLPFSADVGAGLVSRSLQVGAGVVGELPCGCPDHWVPVCATNGRTFPSECLARWVRSQELTKLTLDTEIYQFMYKNIFYSKKIL